MKPVVLAALFLSACGREIPLLRLEPGPPLSLVAAPGARINARLKPALELADGTVTRFDSPRLTPDSAYFADAPTAELPANTNARRGILRASVCPSGEAFCRTITLQVRL